MQNNRITLKNLMEENDYAGEMNEEIIMLPISKIEPNPYQPRYVFDEEKIEELALSIKEHGVFQPIIVKKTNDFYTIISGERRYRACQKLGVESIPAIVRMYEKSKIIELALIENLQREDLTPVEEAKAFRQMMRELEYTQAELGDKVGKSRSYVTNILGLLNLPDDVLSLVDQGMISMGHARVLSKLSSVKKIRSLAKDIIDKELSVRQIEEITKGLEKKSPVIKKNKITKYLPYENRFKERYQGKMKVNDNKITLTFDDDESLRNILEKLCG